MAGNAARNAWGGYQTVSYQAGFGVMLAFQGLALLWFAVYGKGSKESD